MVHNAILKVPSLEHLGNELFCSTEIFLDKQRQLLSTIFLKTILIRKIFRYYICLFILLGQNILNILTLILI